MTDIPYFDGDFWPFVIEEIIKELDQDSKVLASVSQQFDFELILYHLYYRVAR